MKNTFRKFGTQGLSLCVITIAALFVFALAACSNGTTSSSGGNPALTGTVTISGFVKVGTAVSVTTTGLNAASGFSYQWQSADSESGNFTPIQDATNNTYTPVEGDVNKFIRVVVSAAGYTGSVTSNALKVNEEGAEAPDIASITIKLESGSTDFTVNTGGSLTFIATVYDSEGAPVDDEYQGVTWSVSGNEKSDTTISSTEGVLTVAEDETVETLTVTATSTTDDEVFDSVEVTVTNLPALDGYVDIVNADGEYVYLVKAGDTVKVEVNASEVDAGSTFSYQWQYGDDPYDGDFTDIEGKTDENYTVGDAVKGKYIRVVVTCTGYSGSIESGAVKVRAGTPVVTSVTIDGKDENGKITVGKGTSGFLQATVNGENLEDYPDKEITWSMTGSTTPGTSLDEYGYYVIAAGETATELQITATSVTDTSKKDTVTVTLTEPAGKIIKITGLSGQSGEVGVEIRSSFDPDAEDLEMITAFGTIDDGTVTFALEFYDSTFGEWGGMAPWEGSGEYYIQLKGLNYGFDTYVYTNGAELETTDFDDNAKYDIQDDTTTIDFSKFKLIPLGQGGHVITVSGLSSFNGAVAKVELLKLVKDDGGDYSDTVTVGHAVISSGTAAISLAELVWGMPGLDGWTADDGEYYIKLSITDADGIKEYVYTDGETLSELSISTWADFWEEAPTFEFTSTTSSVAFDKFQPGGEDDISWF
ncbi:MAG: hypothetical protein LBB72_09565 [Spirochaetaceae bacterium]|jgi:hypothetical protein|nr:hypothetical protein [Spirochaetaceae bacterium]